VKLVAPPLYVMITSALDKTLGIETLEKSINTITEEIRKMGGNLNVKMKPKAVSESEEQDLADMMAQAAKENLEVSGDDASSGEE
ncbi:translation initiation factor 2, alpha subunit, partial [Piptocephalis cylindrospora]